MPLSAARLLERGYLPRELPPTFTTKAFSEAHAGGLLPEDKQWTECTRHNLARLGGMRRPLKVPNPRSMGLLADVMEKHWSELAKHVHGTKFSISRPAVTRTARPERAIRQRFHIRERPKLRARHWRGKRFVLQTDVSQFYPSFYTHSIPWAFHGKPWAKANTKGGGAGNEIDEAMRRASSGQTVGIPIGPDASFAVAELVLATVDASLQERLGPLSGFRYLDDYEMAFKSRLEAEHALATLEGALGDLELVVNPYKTRILELPHPVDEPWAYQIRTFHIRPDSWTKSLNDVIGLFSYAADVARGERGALKYALFRSRTIDIRREMWRTFEGLVWSAVTAEPTTMATALDLLAAKSAEAEVDVNREAAAEVIETLIQTHAPIRNGSEVVWALWGAIQLGVTLSAKSADEISRMDDNFVALTALHAQSLGLFEAGTLNLDHWEAQIDDDKVLFGPHWLLAYEACRRGWLSTATKRISGDGFFKELSKAGVHFYDTDPQHAPFTGAAGPLSGSAVPDEYL